MSIKNLIVVNFPSNGRNCSQLLKMLQAQSFNSQSFGWKSEDFIIVSNHDKSCDFGQWIKTDLNKNAFTASKLFAVRHIYENNITDEPIWAHDLDAWQNSDFIEPEFLDAGFCHYSRPKINGGSQFWKKSGLDIVNAIIKKLETDKSLKEEPCIDAIYKLYKDRISILDYTYNIGCSGYPDRFYRARKPIQVCHFHPTNRIAWQTHRLDRNGLNFISISEKLEQNIRKYFNPAICLDEEGNKARETKIKENKWRDLNKVI